MTANIISFTALTPEQAADQAVMNQILDLTAKIRTTGPINRGELVCVAHGAAINARLRGDVEHERHFIKIAAEFMAMEISDIASCAVSRRSVLHDLIGANNAS